MHMGFKYFPVPFSLPESMFLDEGKGHCVGVSYVAIFFYKSPPMRREDIIVMCRLFIGQKFRKKITPTPALYPSSKNTDSGERWREGLSDWQAIFAPLRNGRDIGLTRAQCRDIWSRSTPTRVRSHVLSLLSGGGVSREL